MFWYRPLLLIIGVAPFLAFAPFLEVGPFLEVLFALFMVMFWGTIFDAWRRTLFSRHLLKRYERSFPFFPSETTSKKNGANREERRGERGQWTCNCVYYNGGVAESSESLAVLL